MAAATAAPARITFRFAVERRGRITVCMTLPSGNVLESLVSTGPGARHTTAAHGRSCDAPPLRSKCGSGTLVRPTHRKYAPLDVTRVTRPPAGATDTCCRQPRAAPSEP